MSTNSPGIDIPNDDNATLSTTEFAVQKEGHPSVQVKSLEHWKSKPLFLPEYSSSSPNTAANSGVAATGENGNQPNHPTPPCVDVLPSTPETESDEARMYLDEEKKEEDVSMLLTMEEREDVSVSSVGKVRFKRCQ